MTQKAGKPLFEPSTVDSGTQASPCIASPIGESTPVTNAPLSWWDAIGRLRKEPGETTATVRRSQHEHDVYATGKGRVTSCDPSLPSLIDSIGASVPQGGCGTASTESVVMSSSPSGEKTQSTLQSTTVVKKPKGNMAVSQRLHQHIQQPGSRGKKDRGIVRHTDVVAGDDRGECGPANRGGRRGRKSNQANEANVKQTVVRRQPKSAIVTTVKTATSIEELRALRNRTGPMASLVGVAEPGSAVGESSVSAETVHDDDENAVLGEISKLLLRYCLGDEASRTLQPTRSSTELDATEWPTLEVVAEAGAQSKKKKMNADDGHATACMSQERPQSSLSPLTSSSGLTIVVGGDDGSRPDPLAQEVDLYNRLMHLCHNRRVNTRILELLRELLRHTRVIPQPTAGSHGVADAQRRREYVQQIIMVVLNQLKEKKRLEEVRAAEARERGYEIHPGAHFPPATITSDGLSVPYESEADEASTPIFPMKVTGAPILSNNSVVALQPPPTTTYFGPHGVLQDDMNTPQWVPSPFPGAWPVIPPSSTLHVGPATPTDHGANDLAATRDDEDDDMKDVLSWLCDQLQFAQIGATPPESPLQIPLQMKPVTPEVSCTLPTVVVSDAQRQILRSIQEDFQEHMRLATVHGASPSTPGTPGATRTTGHTDNTPLTTLPGSGGQGSGVNRTLFCYHTNLLDDEGGPTGMYLSTEGLHLATSVVQPSIAPPAPSGQLRHDATPFMPRWDGGEPEVAVCHATSSLNAGAPSFIPHCQMRDCAPAGSSEPDEVTGGTSGMGEEMGPSSMPLNHDATSFEPPWISSYTSPVVDMEHMAGQPDLSPVALQAPWAPPELFAQWRSTMEQYQTVMQYAMQTADNMNSQETHSRFPQTVSAGAAGRPFSSELETPGEK